jgi:hypothetical protein
MVATFGHQLTGEALGAVAFEGVDRSNGPKEHRVGGDELGHIAKLERGNAFLKIQTRLADADVILEWQNLKNMVHFCNIIYTRQKL